MSFFGMASAGSATPVLSACKLADDRRSLILRFFNPSNDVAVADVSVPPAVSRVYRADLLEQRREPQATAGRQFRITLDAHRIETFECVLE
jgi:alpha-mannosidase